MKTSLPLPTNPSKSLQTQTNSPSRTTQTPKTTPSLSDLAGAAKPSRNRAVDAYRVLAMGAVAIGHWAAIAITVDADGELVGGNALESAPSMSWFSWLFQVMPLFFVVGGFSSAMSLDSHNAKGGRPQDWVAARLRRMLAPTIVLATTWLAILAAANLAGVGSLAATGAVAAAIPLWFLANYTIDTAIAPYVLPRFRRNPAIVAAGGLGLFAAIETLRFLDIPGLGLVPQANWVLGWLLFQIAGFAWRDGLLPTGWKLGAIASGLWALAIAAVTVGPYPISMVHFPGIGDLSPTHPPSLALLLFGAAYSATALTAAPAVSRWLAGSGKRSRQAWSAVVGANSVAMSVYLWHFTAAVAASAVLYAIGGLPTASVGTAAWWIQKLPLIALSTILLAGIVAVVSKIERRALLAPRTPWNHGQAAMLGISAIISASVKGWAGGSSGAATVGIIGLLAAWHLVLSPRPIPTPSAVRPAAKG